METKAEEPKAKRVNKFGNPDLSPIDALMAGRREDGTIGLWMSREEVSGKGKGAMATFLKNNVDAVRQPEFGKEPDAKGNLPRTGVYKSGKEGVADIAAGFGERSHARTVYFDADAVQAKFAKSRGVHKSEHVAEVIAMHDGREDDRTARRQAALSASRAARKEAKGKEGASM